MTTYEQISSCPKQNYAFWTSEARFNMALYRVPATCTASKLQHKRARRNARLALKRRRKQEHLIP